MRWRGWAGWFRIPAAAATRRRRSTRTQCAVCHGVDRAGSPPAFPSLVDIGNKLTDEQIAHTVKAGTGRMPSFPNIDDQGMNALLHYLRTGDTAQMRPRTRKNLHSAPAIRFGAAAAGAIQRGRGGVPGKVLGCHGDHLEGIQALVPTLMGMGSRLYAAQVTKVIFNGKGNMPAMPDVAGQRYWSRCCVFFGLAPRLDRRP